MRTILVLFVMLFLCTGFLNHSRNKLTMKKPAGEISYQISSEPAVSAYAPRIDVFPKVWIVNNDNFNPLAFNRNQFLMDRKASVILSSLTSLINQIPQIPVIHIDIHNFARGDGEPPLIS